MVLFSTPVSSFHTSKNQGNTAQKNCPAKVLQRKPFLDRPVNSKTPLTKKLSKAESSVKQQISPKNQLKLDEDLEASDHIFSFKNEIDDECDLWPKPAQLGTEGILKILQNYCDNKKITPPPSPINCSMDIDLSLIKLPDITEYNKKKDIIFESISDDVGIPTLESCDCFFYRMPIFH